MQNFYQQLPSYKEKSSWFNQEKFVAFDPSWYLVISDVKGSTQAIENGHYKDVNIVGALSIIALLNLDATHELPFVFGGDGSMILIPKALKEEATKALEGILEIAQTQFHLELRSGIIALEALYTKGYDLQVLKYKPDIYFEQAIFTGNAIAEYEKGLKDGSFPTLTPQKRDVNLQGFECRWRDVYSPKDYTLSILLELREKSSLSYEFLFEQIDTIFTTNRSAISVENLHLAFAPEKLQAEVKIKKSILWLSVLQSVLGSMLMKLGIKTKHTDWKRYKKDVSSACDAEKFDGSLKLVISATHEELHTFRNFLEQHSKELYYGIHQSDRALMTCLVYERNGAQVHFVDSADGGYALAAKELKTQK